MEKVLITGISGQDGLFLTKNLLQESPSLKIYGISRRNKILDFERKIKYLGIEDTRNIRVSNIDLLNKEEIKNFINTHKFTKIYNLTGPSSVYDSVKKPEETFYIITKIFENLIEVILDKKTDLSFFQASSSEMFGKSNSKILTEESEFLPNSPYAKAKLYNHNMVIDLSKELDIKSGIMFNHESEFRDSKYLFSKIIKGAKDIKNKKIKKITVGSLNYERDWLFAGDVTKAIIKITKSGKKNSYVISSGKSHSIEYLISIVFDLFNLNWEKYVEVDSNLLRKNDPEKIFSNPSRLVNELNWKPEYSFEQLIERCVSKS